ELGRRQSDLGKSADAERGREQELLDPFGEKHRADEPPNQDHTPGSVTGIDRSHHSALITTTAIAVVAGPGTGAVGAGNVTMPNADAYRLAYARRRVGLELFQRKSQRTGSDQRVMMST